MEFRQECRKFAEGWIDIQRNEFKRLGITGNWADPYITMDYHAERSDRGGVPEVPDERHPVSGQSKPVMWSPVEKTALAEAEVEYKDQGKSSHDLGEVRRHQCGSEELAGVPAW